MMWLFSRLSIKRVLISLAVICTLLLGATSVVVLEQASTTHAAGISLTHHAVSASALSKPPHTVLPLQVTCAQAVDYSYGRVCVHTVAGVALHITVTYCSGYSATSASLRGIRYSGHNGNFEWDWHPETKCHGLAHAYITARYAGKFAAVNKAFVVR